MKPFFVLVILSSHKTEWDIYITFKGYNLPGIILHVFTVKEPFWQGDRCTWLFARSFFLKTGKMKYPVNETWPENARKAMIKWRFTSWRFMDNCSHARCIWICVNTGKTTFGNRMHSYIWYVTKLNLPWLVLQNIKDLEVLLFAKYAQSTPGTI